MDRPSLSYIFNHATAMTEEPTEHCRPLLAPSLTGGILNENPRKLLVGKALKMGSWKTVKIDS